MAGRYDIDDLLARVDLRQLADELLGGHRSDGHAARWPSPTPGHPQTGRTPPMTIRVGADGRERFHCWSTGAKGTAIDLIGLVYGLPTADAITWLAERVTARGSPILPRDPRPAVMLDRRRNEVAIEAYVAMGEHWLWSSAGRGPLRYLTNQRGLDPAVLRANRVGFDPGTRLERRAHGLPGGPGITLPTFNQHGDLIYVQNRSLRPDATRRYLNPTTEIAPTPALSWPRSTHPDATTLVVCEGLIDALTVTALGHQAVAVLGVAHVSAELARTIGACPEDLIIAFDNDPAGRLAHARLAELLAQNGRQVRCWDLEPGHDLNSSIRTRHAAGPPESVAGRSGRPCPSAS